MSFRRMSVWIAAWMVGCCLIVGCTTSDNSGAEEEDVTCSAENTKALTVPGQLANLYIEPGETQCFSFVAPKTARYRLAVTPYTASSSKRLTVDWFNPYDAAEDFAAPVDTTQKLSGRYDKCVKEGQTYEISIENETAIDIAYKVVVEFLKDEIPVLITVPNILNKTNNAHYYVDCFGELIRPTGDFAILNNGSLCVNINDASDVVDYSENCRE